MIYRSAATGESFDNGSADRETIRGRERYTANRDTLLSRADEITNFRALTNVGLNVPGTLTRQVGVESERKGAIASPGNIGYCRLKRNYTGNRVAAEIIAIDERNKGLTFAPPAPGERGTVLLRNLFR